jgi:signal transduction histidine kinase
MKLILLIDDNQQIRISFGIALRAKGYRVIDADSGVTGLAMAREHLPDLILTDFNMPGGNGQDLLHQIRADPELSSKQVVLMTGRPDLISPRTAMEDGADDFLIKPVKRDALIACMEARLNRGDIHWRVENRALSKMRETMTFHLPHEFFTPLAGIIGLSDIIADELAVLSPSEILDLNKGIKESAQRLHRTLKNYLLALENPDTPAMFPPRLAGLSSNQVKDSISMGIEAALVRHNREKDLIVNCEETALVVSEKDLTIIVEELVDNAFKFSRRGTPIEVTLSKDGSFVVSDHGRGMTKEEIDTIRAFYQFDRKKYEQQGLGLGLCLVQKLAARNGAHFSITPNPGAGLRAQTDFKSHAL